MLKREQAQEQLKRIYKENYVDELVAAAKELAGPAQEAVCALLGRSTTGETFSYFTQDWQKARARAILYLEKAPASDRLGVFRTLLGEIAPAAEQAWQYFPRLIYQFTGYRRPFRVSNRPELFRDRRLDWLTSLAQMLGGYRHSQEVNLGWLAAWAPHLGYAADDLGILFAASLDAGGPDGAEVFDILTASAKNEHAIGSMGRHVSRALLTCSKPEAWEFVEKLLLAAQRQEGLRQVVLETIDEAHPQAFRRILRLIIDQNLIRFSAVARAINVWFGFQWDSISTGAFNKILTRIAEVLDSEEARQRALAGSDAEEVYFALWALAYDNAETGLERARQVLRDKAPQKRFAALTLVSQLALPEGRPVLLNMMDDPDLRIAVAAHRAAVHSVTADYDDSGELRVPRADHFERLERLLERMPERKTIALKPLLWPWTALSVDRAILLQELVNLLGNRPVGRLLKYRDDMNVHGRARIAQHLAWLKEWDAEARRAALELAGDSSTQVREYVLQSLQRTRIAKDEAAQLEGYLTRKAPDLRRGVVALLLSQEDADALASADRLLAAGPGPQRLAGLELLRQLAETARQADACRDRARAYQADHRKLSKDEQTQLDAILAEKQETLTLDNALGLMNPAERTKVTPPAPRPVPLNTPAAIACLQALDALVEEHKNHPVTTQTYQGPQEQLLGNCQWGLPWPDVRKPRDEQLVHFPARDVVEAWYKDRPASQRDSDGFELLRAQVWGDLSGQRWYLREWPDWEKRSPQIKEALAAISGGHGFIELKYPIVVQSFLVWLRFAHPEEGLCDFLLDANESLFARLPTDQFITTEQQMAALSTSGLVAHVLDAMEDLQTKPDWRDAWMFGRWRQWLEGAANTDQMTPEQYRRFWHLEHWLDQPIAGAARRWPAFWIVLGAFQRGFATEADILDEVLGPRLVQMGHYGGALFDSLNKLTARKPEKAIADDPRLLVLADRCRERLLAIELARGETVTPASLPATYLGALFGVDKLIALLHGLGKDGFKKLDQWRRTSLSKPAVLSALVRVTFPGEADTPETFARQMREAVRANQFPEDRLIELAFQAPQWSAHVARYFDWPGFQEGVWWFLAHMSAYVGDLGDVDAGDAAQPAEETASADQTGQTKPEPSPWEKIIRQRTPLSEEERRNGAVDMAWFRRVYQELGDKRWRRMGDAAKWGGSSTRARKALHLGDVILGKASLKELVSSITQKRLKESVRLLGIYPLPPGPQRDKALGQRYKVMVDYRRYAKQLGAMTKPMAMQAAQVGMENLARTAGFPDPIRLEWAMEGATLADIGRGPVKVTHKGVSASLFLDEQRQAQLVYEKAGRPLKSLPAELKKHEKFAELIERRTELRRQSSRTKESLENAMCRGDCFTGAELQTLMSHPLLAPMLERLVLAGDGILGYPVRQGKALRDFAGKLEPVGKKDTLRIGHAHDLFASKRWHDWQRECFQAERVQPFKQVFRELYLVTKQEKKDGAISLRYEGHQVNPRQATALFNTRNWNTTDGIWKTFYDVNITSSVWFKYGYGTPLDVEGWTLEGVEFRLRDELKPMPLDKVPPRLFSEVMRDLDLVVSVAHRGGVDPEASASTVEMRANLLRETCALLKIKNYKITDSHVLIDGKLGDYSVHLGSAMVHRRPGGAVCILPVAAQHRGRLFLPFADDDPKTAEVLSKVLLLARDADIQDPTILEQLR